MRACLFAAFFLAAAVCAALAQVSTVPEGWTFALPAGDPAAGEKVFRENKCASCHDVSGKGFERVERSGELAPTLTARTAAMPAEYLANRFISTDRFLPHGAYKATYSRSDGSSRMGNYNESMTVQELIDLVAFIKSIE